MSSLEDVVLTVDEYEALRLADLETYSQEQAAARMKISRPTFGRVVEKARKTVADAVVNGKAILIEGGNYRTMVGFRCRCNLCGRNRKSKTFEDKNRNCPECRRGKESR